MYLDPIRRLKSRPEMSDSKMPVDQLKAAYISLMATAATLATAPEGHPTTSEDLAYFQEAMEEGADAIPEVLEQLGIPLPSPQR